MTPEIQSLPRIRDAYQNDIADLRQTFERSGDGSASIRRRSTLVDKVLRQLWTEIIAAHAEPFNITLVATGGFGRRELFPFSDVDVLFLCGNDGAERDFHQAIRATIQAMWDTGLRASPSIRTWKECDRVDPDNLEFLVSLLDRRYLCGDYSLYRRFENDLLPSLVLREWNTIVQNLAEIARARHAKYGNTIFHLEPNIKECPGGLRDYHLAQWLSLLFSLQENKAWPKPTGNSFFTVHNDLESAFDFLAATRCFLHYRSGRDNNTLDWHAQDGAAAQSIGLETRGSADPAYWMRTYYRNARTIFRRASLLMDDVPPPRRSFYKQFRRRRTPVPGTDFVLEQGRLDLNSTGTVNDAEMVLRIFGQIAKHGYKLSQNAEDRIAEALPALAVQMPEGPFLWNCLREVLLGPHAAHALRTMHALGLLELVIPEFHGIDALVIRDSYHRYTVDEHTFLVIDNVHALRQPAHDWEERETIRRLIRNHLDMSSALRRDIFDPQSIRAFGEKVNSQQQLKMLTLLTYADIKSVAPEALTPWKAENLWQLYIATSNFLDRSVDEERYHVESDTGTLNRILALVPDRSEELKTFLEGIPQRYLQTHLPDQIRSHFRMALALAEDPVQLAFRPLRQLHEVTLITKDRPMLFAEMAGVLSAWGMNIVKADAFSNSAGIIVDTLQFTDSFQTLELNPTEVDRFLKSIRDVISRQVPLETLLRARSHVNRHHQAKVKVETRLMFDNEASSHSTLLQVVAQDTPGLLRELAKSFAEQQCNIEVALIDTEGEVAIDVFYLTSQGKKLELSQQRELGASLEKAIEELR